MPRLDYKRCRCCGRGPEEVGPLSHTRLCPECGKTARENNNWQLHTHHGPYFNRWRERTAASVGAVLIEYLEV
jgi:hypothetical protein